MLMHNYGGGRGEGTGLVTWGNSVFTKWNSFKTKNNNYLLYIFVVTIAFIHFHGFPLDLSAVLSKLTIFLSLVYVNNC